MNRDRTRDVAVVGLSGRFPGVTGLDEWWSALVAGATLTRRYTRADLLAAGVAAELADDPGYVPVRGHLDDTDRFENTLFRISPREAETMDPQHRLMLEAAWSALEDAGCDPTCETAVTGVFASATGSGYLRAMVADGRLDQLSLDDAIHGTEPDFMASRIAYKLGLTGPALAVQTACSSSLVAVHLAVQSLLAGDCDQALVVAAGIGYPQTGHLHLPGGVLTATGACRPFDENADGVLPGSGVACVVLRRLADTGPGDVPPHGVILGSAVNNDGATRAGYYAPSGEGQERVIRAALHTAGIDAASVGYLEAHGTGTFVGDPIEWSAASDSYAAEGASEEQIAVGAVKANIGHLDAAAGLASLIKTLLVLRHGVVPPVAGFSAANPMLDTAGSPLRIPVTAETWDAPGPRRAGISAFGIGGTNAHVIVEAAPEPEPPLPPGAGDRLVTLSAATPEALTGTATRLAGHLERHGADLADVGRTLTDGRAVLAERLAVSAGSAAELARRLATGAGVVRGAGPRVPAPLVLLFPGQGSQYPGMAAALAAALPGFSGALGACLDAFEPALAARVRPALLDLDSPAAGLDATELAQPALFAVEYAATVALHELGLRPAALAGHSLGEITAACVAGVLDLTVAARFVAARGRAMQACPPGAMLAVSCGPGRAGELVREYGAELTVAAVNTEDSCVLAGAAAAVDEFHTWLADRLRATRLRTDRAFHSRLIAPAAPALAEALAATAPGTVTVPFASGATGELLDAGDAVAPALFVDQALGAVRFADGLAAINRRFPGALAVEVGPGRALSAMAIAAGLDAVPLHPGRGADPADEIRTALGRLWVAGQPLDRTALSAGGRLIHLPGHAFAGPRRTAAEATPWLRDARAATPVPAVTTAAADAATAPAAVADPARVLPELWADLLGQDGLTGDADFFQLGGDSLLVTHLARRITTALGVRVPLRDLLAGRTLGGQIDAVTALLRVPAATGA